MQKLQQAMPKCSRPAYAKPEDDEPKEDLKQRYKTPFPSRYSILSTNRLCPPPTVEEQSIDTQPNYSLPKKSKCGEEEQQQSSGYCKKEEQQLAKGNKRERLDQEYEAKRAKRNKDPAYSPSSPCHSPRSPDILFDCPVRSSPPPSPYNTTCSASNLPDYLPSKQE